MPQVRFVPLVGTLLGSASWHPFLRLKQDSESGFERIVGLVLLMPMLGVEFVPVVTRPPVMVKVILRTPLSSCRGSNRLVGFNLLVSCKGILSSGA